MKNGNSRVLSRREFAQRAAMLSATASLVPAGTILELPPRTPPEQSQQNLSKLSPASRKEVEARYQNIISLYGDRLDDQQKASIKELCAMLQPSLERLRAFPIENGDAPALYLKPLVEREKKPQAVPNPNPPASARKS